MSAYRMLQPDYSTADVERFTALSIRRGAGLESIGRANEDDLRVVAGAMLLGVPEGTFDSEALERAVKGFLRDEADWLRAEPEELIALAKSWGLLEETDGGFVSRLEPRIDVSRCRLLDEIESAQVILEERRRRAREALQARNREVNAPPAPLIDDEADVRFMAEAQKEAEAAGAAGEVPVGAVLVREGEIVARAGNRTIRDKDPTAHAEVLVMREAARKLGNHRLNGTTLYVTLEPCPMCAGAIAEARCARIVYGAPDPRRGAVAGALELFAVPGVNHRPHVTSGVGAEAAAKLLSDFFAARRAK